VNLTRRSLLIGTAASAGTAAVIAFAQGPPARLVRTALFQNSGRTVDVGDFGAIGDGRTDDRAAIQRAIDTLAGSGGGTVQLAAKVYSVGRNEAGPFALQLRSNIRLNGEGMGSVIRLADHVSDGVGSHTLYIDQAKSITVSNLAVDGNRQNQRGSGHGLKTDGVEDLLLTNLVVRNTYSYGLGFQEGVNRRIRIDGVMIHDTGADGIDFKNRQNANADIDIVNVSIQRWGLRPELHIQTAIDCRGPVRMENIHLSDPGAEDNVGIRMRQGEIGDKNGLGGHFSTLNGFMIEMNGRAQIAIDVPARSVSVSNGSVQGGLRGIDVLETGFKAESTRVSGCSSTGIFILAHGAKLEGDSALLSNCVVTGCGGNGIEVDADNVKILDCMSSGNGKAGLLIDSTANATQVTGGGFSNNRGGAIVNRGTNSTIAVTRTAA
jgi:hypothetical protein